MRLSRVPPHAARRVLADGRAVPICAAFLRQLEQRTDAQRDRERKRTPSERAKHARKRDERSRAEEACLEEAERDERGTAHYLPARDCALPPNWHALGGATPTLVLGREVLCNAETRAVVWSHPPRAGALRAASLYVKIRIIFDFDFVFDFGCCIVVS